MQHFQEIEGNMLQNKSSEVGAKEADCEGVRLQPEQSSSFQTGFQHFQEIESKILATKSPESSPKETECQRIRLEPEQASQVPFPPGCPVVVLDSSRISCTGEVTSVHVSFARNTGSCDNYYDVSYVNCDGQTSSQIVKGTQLRYAMNCPIRILPRGDSDIISKISVDGVIKGFELYNTNTVNPDTCIDHLPTFLYSVEVSGRGSEGQKRLFCHRGISAEHITYRPTMESSYLGDEKSSIVSFEDNFHFKDDLSKNVGAKANYAETDSNTISPQSTFDGMHQKSVSPAVTSPKMDSNIFQDESSTLSVTTSPYSKCTPLPPPIPSKFQGDMEKYSYTVVPEFCTLVNFPSSTARQSMLPDGMKCCVMCGQKRFLSSPKTSKNRAKAFQSRSEQVSHLPMIPAQNKGLCTYCDVNVWVVKESGLQIKWCKGCKNFQPWAHFGSKGTATKCLRCRERQREKYAANKMSGMKRKQPST